jgi:hypothetical protein
VVNQLTDKEKNSIVLEDLLEILIGNGHEKKIEELIKDTIK